MKKNIITLICLLSAFSAHPQIAELRIKSKFPLQISYVSDPKEVLPILRHLIELDSNQICFKITPQEKQKTWSKKYFEMLEHLKIYQGKEIQFDHVPPIQDEFEKKVRVYFVDKRKLMLSQSFEFRYDDILSSSMRLPESLMSNFTPFMDIVNNAEDLINNHQYREAFIVLSPLLPQDFQYNNYSSITKYRHGIQLIYSAVDKYYNSEKLQFQNIANVINQELNIENLEKLRNSYNEVLSADTLFMDFFNYNGALGIESAELKSNFKTFVDEISIEKIKQETIFKEQSLAFFVNSNYSNQKFKFLLDVITNILLHSEGITAMEELQIESLNVAYIAEMPLLNQVLKSTPSLEREITMLLDIINQNIKQRIDENINDYVLFDEAIFKHLEYLQFNDHQSDILSMEPKPYYLIIRGFNLIMCNKKNINQFSEYLEGALRITGDEQLARKIQLWLTSCKLNFERLDNTSNVKLSVQYFNIGYNFFQENKYDSALVYFQKSEMRFKEYADPIYFQGLVYKNIGYKYLAKYYCKKALEINPDYLSARIDFVKMTESKIVAEIALIEVDSLLRLPSNLSLPPVSRSNHWYLNYLKAQLHYVMEDYNNSMLSLQAECKRLNPSSPNIYVLEGLINLKCDREKESILNFNEAMCKAIDNFYDYQGISKKIEY